MLEIRQVPTTAVLQAGVLTITGSDQPDSINVTKTGTNLAVSGVSTTFAVSKVKSVMVNAGGGDDTVDLTALTVKAKVSGGAGNDSLIGGSGNDTLMGEAGNDSLTGNAGNDSLDGGADVDQVRESANVNFALTNSRLTGRGTDTITAIETAWLQGGTGNNKLDASKFTGSVSLFGGDGKDTLLGGSGGDQLFGELGNDNIDGGAGFDVVDGVGNDVTKNIENSGVVGPILPSPVSPPPTTATVPDFTVYFPDKPLICPPPSGYYITDDWPNQIGSQQGVIPLGVNGTGSMSGRIEVAGDIDTFQVTVTTAGQLSLSAFFIQPGQMTLVTLWNSSGQVLAMGMMNVPSQPVGSSVSPGTYYIQVSGYTLSDNGQYTLAVNFNPSVTYIIQPVQNPLPVTSPTVVPETSSPVTPTFGGSLVQPPGTGSQGTTTGEGGNLENSLNPPQGATSNPGQSGGTGGGSSYLANDNEPYAIVQVWLGINDTRCKIVAGPYPNQRAAIDDLEKVIKPYNLQGGSPYTFETMPLKEAEQKCGASMPITNPSPGGGGLQVTPIGNPSPTPSPYVPPSPSPFTNSLAPTVRNVTTLHYFRTVEDARAALSFGGGRSVLFEGPQGPINGVTPIGTTSDATLYQWANQLYHAYQDARRQAPTVWNFTDEQFQTLIRRGIRQSQDLSGIEFYQRDGFVFRR